MAYSRRSSSRSDNNRSKPGFRRGGKSTDRFDKGSSSRRSSFAGRDRKQGSQEGDDRPRGAGKRTFSKPGFRKSTNKKSGGFRKDQPTEREGEFDRKKTWSRDKGGSPFKKRSEGGFEKRRPRPGGQGGDRFERRGPRPEGKEGGRFERRGPRPEGKEGGRFERRGPRPEGRDGGRFDRRGPRPEGKEGGRFERRGPRPEGRDGGRFDRRGPRPEGKEGGRFERRGPRPEGKSGDRFERKSPGFRGRREDRFERRGPRPEGKRDERFERSSERREDRGKKPSFIQSRLDRSREHRRHDRDPEKTDDGLIRLNKFISNSGVCSRREADDLISMGLITVNGKSVTEMGYKVKPTDDVRYEGKRLKAESMVYILLNKPKGFITTTDDPEERNTVMQLIEGACKQRVYPVGRLDRNTSGLLLLTNDGDLTDKLTHPSYNVKKIYKAELDKPLTKADFQKVRDGVHLEEGRAMVDDLAVVSEDGKTVGIEIHIGWNRVIRRIFEALGYEVIKLDRSVYAGLDKKDVPRGHWRFLREEEVVRLKHFK